MADPTATPTANAAAARPGTAAQQAAAAAVKARTPTMMLLNPQARGGRARKLHRDIEVSLTLANPRPLFFMTEDVRSARRLIDALPAGSRVIIAGGDGSVQRLLPSLIAGGHTLALVPVGSGNDTARALGVAGKNWRKALDIALHAPASLMDVGEISYTEAKSRSEKRAVFLSSLAAGFDASVTARAAEVPAWLGGRLRYLLATLAELTALRSVNLEISTDGDIHHHEQVLLASSLNTRTYGAGMPVAPLAIDSDGQLDLMLAKGMGVKSVLKLLPLMLAGRHLGRPGVHHRRYTILEANAAEPLPIAADGEYLGEVRAMRIVLRPALLSVVRRPAPPTHA